MDSVDRQLVVGNADRRGAMVGLRARLCSLLLLALMFAPIEGVAQAVYQQISLSAGVDQNVLSRFPSFDQHTVAGQNGRIHTILSREDVEQVIQMGLDVRVEIEDLSRHYRDRAEEEHALGLKNGSLIASSGVDPLNFRIGSAGGAYTLEEITSILDSMELLYPALVSSREIGESVEGRPIRLLSITSPGGSGEKVPLLYTGLHHAREPISATALIYSMWTLLEAFGEESTATRLLESRRLDFVPVVNPDGYAKNLAEFPQGGGLWRKNLGENRQGVDLNRNYGPDENWSSPNDGDNLLPSSLNYRGSAPFSEPETAAMRNLMEAEDYAVVLHHHSFGDLLLMDHSSHRDDEISEAWRIESARALSRSRGLGFGSSEVAIGYRSSGSATRWMAMQKDLGGYSWTPETGNLIDGFWPLPSRYLPLARETHQVNMAAAYAAGASIVLKEYQLLTDGSIRLQFVNSGTRASTDSSRVHLDGIEPFLVRRLRPGESIEYVLEADLVSHMNSRARSLQSLSIETEGLISLHPITLLGGDRTELFSDNFESGLAQWDQDLWGVESVDGVGRVLADSPYEETRFNPFGNRMLLREVVDLRGFQAAEVSFDLRGVLDGRNYALSVEVREGDGEWEPLSSEYFQSDNAAEGNHRKTVLRGEHDVWTRFHLSLDDHLGKLIDLSFHLETRGESSVDVSPGVLIDNLKVEGALDRQSSVSIGSVPLREEVPMAGIVLNRRSEIDRALRKSSVVESAVRAGGTFELYDAIGRLLLRDARLDHVAELLMEAEAGTFTIRTDGENAQTLHLLLL